MSIPPLTRWAAIGMPLLVVAAVMSRLAMVAVDHFECRSDLVYESPNLATIRQIQAGQPIYDPCVYDDTPFVLTMYTPLYHLLAALLPASSEHPFLAGRIVSALAMLAVAGLLFAPGRPSRAWLLPVVAVGAFFCIRPVVSNTAFLRHDPLGLLFSVSAVLAIAGPRRSWRHVALSGGLAAAAFLTKQSFVTCGVSCLLFLWLQDRRQAALFMAGWFGPVLAAAAGLAAWCGAEGVWFSWFVAPRNPLSQDVFWLNAKTMLRQPVFVLLLAMVAATLWAAPRREGRAFWRDSPFPIFLAVSGLAAAVMSAKIGAATNVYFEFVMAGLLWLLHSFRRVSPAELARPLAALVLLGISLVEAAELTLAKPSEYTFVNRQPWQVPGTSQFVSYQELKEGRIAQARQELSLVKGKTTHLLNLTPEVWMTSSLTGELCLNDPLAYAVLWDQGSLSAEPLLAALARQDFDVILLPSSDTPPTAVPWFHKTAAWLAVVEAVDEHYRTEREGVYRYMVRR